MRLPVLIAAALLSACSANAPENTPGPLPETPVVELVSGSEDTIAPEIKTCSADAHCTLVGTGCDGCCQLQAVNEAYVDRYRAEFAEACRGYAGPVCDCVSPPTEARCIRRTCEAVVSGR